MPPKRKKVRGKGVKKIYDGIKYRIDAITNFKPRGNEPTGRFEKFLNETDGKRVKRVYVGRKPIVKGIEKALNILSLGGFSKVKKRLKYDDIYHQYMIVEMEDGSRKKMERNHVVESHDVNEDDYKDILLSIDVDKPLTTRDLINNAVKKDAESDFWRYNPKTSNCVEFVREVVDGSELLPPTEDTNKVLGRQDSEQLINSIPEPLRDVPLAITNIASAGDKIIYGRGMTDGIDIVNKVKNKIRGNDLLTTRMILEGKI